ncbi:MAG: DUF4369 domain-containing protein [Bacteroidales bacterium]|nr:DUF4369 domain-containing protein [Bacteroidales bacterium]
MKRFLPFILVLFATLSCKPDGPMLEIRGRIDGDFEGQKIYFCPQPRPTADIVDSTVVRGGTFFFRIPADSLYMADITLSRRAPGFAERILLAVEPGILEVTLGAPSRAQGTPRNDQLQQWKEQLQGASSAEEAKRCTFDMVCRSHDAVGGYLYMLFRNSFDADQQHWLDSLGYDKLIPDVSTRRKK